MQRLILIGLTVGVLTVLPSLPAAAITAAPPVSITTQISGDNDVVLVRRGGHGRHFGWTHSRGRHLGFARGRHRGWH